MHTKKWSAKNKINSTTWDKNDICDFTQCEVKQKNQFAPSRRISNCGR